MLERVRNRRPRRVEWRDAGHFGGAGSIDSSLNIAEDPIVIRNVDCCAMDQYVRYVTGIDEIKAASLFLTKRGSVIRRAAGRSRLIMYLGLFGLIFVALIVVMATTPPPSSPRPQQSGSSAILLLPLAFVALFVVFAVAMGRIWKRVYWRYLRKHGEVDVRLGDTELELAEEGVHIDYRAMRVVYKWNGVTAVDEDEKYVYISAGPLHAVAVPKRAFGNEADAALFRDALRGKMRSGHLGGF
jgi:hypothetical protein